VTRVAVIGAGVAGLAAARALAGRAEVTVIEAAARPGGHVHTIDVDGPRGPIAVDLGFIVCNRETYPRFFAILDELGVATHPTSMSFSVKVGDDEWSSRGRGRIRFLVEVLRFLRQARRDVGSGLARATTLDEYLAARRVAPELRDRLVIPLASALWSIAPERCGEFPAETYLRFLDRHGMLRPIGSFQWHTIAGGSRRYVDALVARLPATIWTSSPVRSVARDGRGVTVEVGGGHAGAHRFDRAIVATHADDALALLADADGDERRVLAGFGYGDNRIVLHGDETYLPSRPVRASWNYATAGAGATVTYWMNRLQGLPDAPTLLVTMDPTGAAAPRGVLHATTMAHPRFDRAAIAAQRELPRLQGARRTYFAGAHLGYGFHEDGVRSGEDAAARLLRDAEAEA
jgi:predicted NAD/FAD-binding protein